MALADSRLGGSCYSCYFRERKEEGEGWEVKTVKISPT